MLKTLPHLLTDEDAEQFVATADLSEYDLSGFVPARFRFSERQEEAVRLSTELLSRVDAMADRAGKSRIAMVEELVERGLRDEAA